MISLEKLKILTPLQNLPKNVGDLGQLIVAKGFKSCPKSTKSPNLVTLPSIKSSLTVESSIDEHCPVQHDGRMSKSGQICAQVLRNGRLDVVPRVAQDVVDQDIGRVALGPLRPEENSQVVRFTRSIFYGGVGKQCVYFIAENML